MMNPKKIMLSIILLSLLLPLVNASDKATIYFFWGDGCPHCADEKPFLESLDQKYPEIDIKMFETWKNPENARLFSDVAKAYGTSAQGVPTTFIDDKVWVGYTDKYGEEIEEKVRYCLENECISPADRLAGKDASVKESDELCIHAFIMGECNQCNDILPYLSGLKEKYEIELKIHDVSEDKETYEKFKENYGIYGAGFPIVFIGDKFIAGESSIKENLEPQVKYCLEKGCTCPASRIDGKTPYPPNPKDITPEQDQTVTLPFIGTIDTSNMSLPIFTIILAGLDSFNPCAFFVLFFLLSMLIHAKSRKRMLLIGGTFIFFSGLIYFLFMAAWLNLFLLIGQLMIITMVAGVVALAVGIINIKDFFFFKKGVSLTISDKAKPKLFDRMRNLLKASSLTSMIFGTIVLAIAANSYELLCTAGFPMVFTRMLTLNGISTSGYYLYLMLYNIVYVIPLAIIVLIFTITLGSRKLSQWEGQVLKLISGIMMLCLGSVLLINPALLNNVFTAIGLLAIALTIAGIIIFITKKIRKK